MKINSAVLRKMGEEKPYKMSQPLQVEQVELEEPGIGEVQVKMIAAGLCHSDLSVISGVRPRPLPMSLGHEASAEIIKVGPNVKNLKVGQKVVLIFVPSCGQCTPCREGRPALCEPGNAANAQGVLLNGGSKLKSAHDSIHHHCGISAFSEYAVVSENSCIPIGDDLDPVEAAVFGCAVLTGVGTVVNTAKITAGSSALIVGLGGVGLSGLLGAIASGAYPIVVADLNQDKLNLALELGATYAVNVGDVDAVEQVKKLTNGGVDFAFEFAGAVAAMQFAYNSTRRGGTTVTAGLPHPEAIWPIHQLTITAEERTIKGSYIGSSIPSRDIPRYIALYQAGKLPIHKLIGKKIKLNEINEGFDRLSSGESLRDLIVF